MKIAVTYLLLFFVLCITSCKEDVASTDTNKDVPISNTSLNHVEPPHWWTGMKNNQLQLLVNHTKIGDFEPKITYDGVSIEAVHQADSPNYLFVDLLISESAQPGKFDVVFTNVNNEKLTHTYELKSRDKKAEDYIGFDSRDAIYLITPDRFANGDTTNDVNDNLREKIINRKDDYGRHGGDIKGITSHLDYIDNLGFTAIWPTPMLINDMPQASYHGYAITDFYQVDPRFGTLSEYKELASKLKEKDMKLIMDMVANHCGSKHWWMEDLPFKDWVNQQEALEADKPLNNSNHRRTVNQDLYASKRDKKEMNEGWFVRAMPDLNQRNPFMAKYIIQNNIWWIETLQLNGIRQDTYPYPDKNFMSDWAGAIMNEYPNFSIVGEEWSTNPLLVAYWQDGHHNKDGYQSNLRSTMDFPMQKAIVDALNENESWNEGLVKIYEGLANDFAYTSPKDIMVFPDNHDMSRIFTQLKGDVSNTQMALGLIATLPRIPQVYYGTEILMNDFEKPGDHGLLRGDFPGGWETDSINAFKAQGLNENQLKMQQFISKIFKYRKNSPAIQEGKTIHFAPFMGTYFLFRNFGNETLVLILNKNENPITVDLKRYDELGLNGNQLINIVSDEQVTWSDSLTLNSRGITLLTTKK
ncbi:alpha-amlyase [Hanstruepera neustonica]|uniref:Alpha-amlyase n=1 Tax=Hanstruepera neustonica TaxID=1445657 RepID=A0A2K1E4F7_9FLAO|nr:glycoside hydrolase family 13 protein [Hanstruepera neustonica]PNQ75150.1 alpha-amlyase [Hanstruepera neustonica]